MVYCYAWDKYFLWLSNDARITHRVAGFGNIKGKQYDRIVETPFFVNSLYSPGIQIADLFAAIIRRQEEMMAKGEFCKFTDQFYKRVKSRAYETKKVTENGFKITGYLKPFK